MTASVKAAELKKFGAAAMQEITAFLVPYNDSQITHGGHGLAEVLITLFRAAGAR